MIGRRALFAGASALAVSGTAAFASGNVIRVGTQKGAGIVMAERQRHGLETLLNPRGIEVQWVEFQFGPPLLEAMRVGGVDIGLVGDTPPIFAQAARSDLLYVAAVPSGASAILLPAGSTLQTIRDLKGKRVAFARGSSSHNLTIAAVEKAGLTFGDIQPISLAPADAAAAFEKGVIDAWTIWDPYYALYQSRPGVRVLVESTGIAPQNSFFIARRAYVEANPAVVATVIDEFAQVSEWAAAHRDAVARLVTEATGVPYEATSRAADRSPFKILPVTRELIQSQQDIADRFHRLGVLPARITIADQVWEWHPKEASR